MAKTDEGFNPYPAMDAATAPRAAYFHVPFCLHRCGYCDFTLVAERDDLIPAWLAGLKNELSRLHQQYTVDSIFIGGGTPTHLNTEQLGQLIELITANFALSDGGEFSIEANPDGLDNGRLDLLRDLGVNRLSLGVQSFDDQVLKTLERQHTRDEALDVVGRAAERFPNLSLDLIFGVPGLSLESWLESISTAIALPLKHVSTYGLTFEKGTDFFQRMQTGNLAVMPDELERDMYAAVIQRLPKSGFKHYEISNFAKPGFECRHNTVYWAAEEYFAFGPGAARYVDGIRSTNARNVTRWINSWARSEIALQESEQLNADEKVREAVFLGLRRIDGINLTNFEQRFSVHLQSYAAEILQKHIDTGLLEIENDHLRLTAEGRFIADTVISDFL